MIDQLKLQLYLNSECYFNTLSFLHKTVIKPKINFITYIINVELFIICKFVNCNYILKPNTYLVILLLYLYENICITFSSNVSNNNVYKGFFLF